MRLIEGGFLSAIADVDADIIFALKRKSTCDCFCEDLSHLVPLNNFGELRWYTGCRLNMDRESGSLTIYQTTFTGMIVDNSCVASGRKIPVVVGLR